MPRLTKQLSTKVGPVRGRFLKSSLRAAMSRNASCRALQALERAALQQNQP